MADAKHYKDLHEKLTALVNELSLTWDASDLRFTREELEHDEYGEALDSLVSTALDTGKTFSPDQAKIVRGLFLSMGIHNSDLFAQFDKAYKEHGQAGAQLAP